MTQATKPPSPFTTLAALAAADKELRDAYHAGEPRSDLRDAKRWYEYLGAALRPESDE